MVRQPRSTGHGPHHPQFAPAQHLEAARPCARATSRDAFPAGIGASRKNRGLARENPPVARARSRLPPGWRAAFAQAHASLGRPTRPRPVFVRCAIVLGRPNPFPIKVSPNDSEFREAVLGPGLFVRGGISRHLRAETDRLNLPAGRALRDEVLPHGQRPPFAEAAVVLGRAAFIGEPGYDDRLPLALEKARDFAKGGFVALLDGKAVEREVDGLEAALVHAVAHEGGAALGPVGERRAVDGVAFHAGVVLALLIRASAQG